MKKVGLFILSLVVLAVCVMIAFAVNPAMVVAPIGAWILWLSKGMPDFDGHTTTSHEKEALPPSATTSGGRGALISACAAGNAQVVRILLERGIDPNTKESLLGWSVLKRAAYAGHLDVVRALVSAGAEIDEDIIQIAQNRRHKEIVKALRNG